MTEPAAVDDDGAATEEEQVQSWPDPPAYNFARAQECFCIAASSIERKGDSSRRPDQRFWRRVTWSPDGTHLLAQSDDHFIDVFHLREEDANHKLVKIFSIRAPSTLLAMEWYPFARYDDATSWCFAMSVRDVPTRLVDAHQGKTRATYGIINHVERFIGPQAIAFSLDGTRLYCALEAEVAIFDLSQPGVNTHTSLHLTPPKRDVFKGKASVGQRGQISCLTVVEDHFGGTSKELLAIGTFAGTVGIYHMGDGDFTAEERCMAGWDECSAGITQIAFHPSAPQIIFITSRRSNLIRAYDLQYIGSRKSFLHPPAHISLLGTFERSTTRAKESQQKFGFHIDWAGRYLAAGDADGLVRVWNISQPSVNQADSKEGDDFFGKILRDGEQAARPSISHLHAANDAIASVNMHPLLPLFVITSGARHWDDVADEDVSPDSDYYTRDGHLRLFSAI